MGAAARRSTSRTRRSRAPTCRPRSGSWRRPRRPEEFDLLLAGLDTSDGMGGAVAAGVAARLGLPLLSSAAAIEPDPAAGTRPRPPAVAPRATTSSRRRCRRSSRAPRRSARRATRRSRGSWPPARREIASRSLADLWRDAACPPAAAGRPEVVAADPPPARAAGRVVAGAAGRGRARGRRLPRRRGGSSDAGHVILAVAEVADGALTKLSTEVATLARALAEAAGGTAVGPRRRCGAGRRRRGARRRTCRGSSR